MYTKLIDSEIYNYDKHFKVWVTLLCKCFWHKGIVNVDGKNIELDAGQLLTGRKALSEKTGYSESTIEDILKWLEIRHQIRQQKTTKYRIISIVNWKDYQESDIKSDNKNTTERHNIEVNRLKEEKKVYSDDFENFWKQYPARNGVKQGKSNAFKHHLKLTDSDKTQLMVALANYKLKCGEFPKDAERFIKNDFWKDYLVKETPKTITGAIKMTPEQEQEKLNKVYGK